MKGNLRWFVLAALPCLISASLGNNPAVAADFTIPEVFSLIAPSYSVPLAPNQAVSWMAQASTVAELRRNKTAPLHMTLSAPVTIAADYVGNLYIADSMTAVVWQVGSHQKNAWQAAGGSAHIFGSDGADQAGGAWGQDPIGLATNATGNLYVGDANQSNCIQLLRAGTAQTVSIPGGGQCLTDATSNGVSGDLSPDAPTSIAVDAAGDLYYASRDCPCVREVKSGTGVIVTIAGGNGKGYSGDSGPASQAKLNQPSGLAMDSAGNIYISDTGNNRVREIHVANGRITTVAGTGYTDSHGYGGDSGDGGPATAARLSAPMGLLTDGKGNLFIADSHNNRVREVHAGSGIITTVAGTGYTRRTPWNSIVGGFTGDGGPAVKAELNWPTSVALDGKGNLYIADADNYRVREVHVDTGIITTVAGNGTFLR